MAQQPDPELRQLAAKIAASYARANPMPVDTLPHVIKAAYATLLSCSHGLAKGAVDGAANSRAGVHRPSPSAKGARPSMKRSTSSRF